MKPAPAIAPMEEEPLRALLSSWLMHVAAVVSELIGPNMPRWLVCWLDDQAYAAERGAQFLFFILAAQRHTPRRRAKRFSALKLRSRWRRAARCGFAQARHLRADQRIARVREALRNPAQHVARYLRKLRTGYRTTVPAACSAFEALTSALLTTHTALDTS